MPRAGSGWHYNLVHDLVVAAGGQDARTIRRRFLLAPILTEVNCNIGALTAKRLLPTLLPAALGQRYVIKTHAGPKPLAGWLVQRGWLKPIYVYRDPRAAALSAYEYGRRGLEAGRANAFSHLTTIEEALDFMRLYVEIWAAWRARPQTLVMRYEDLLGDYETETARLLAALRIAPDLPGVPATLEKYRPGQTRKEDRGMHFHKGQPERFRTALTAGQLARAAELFGPALLEMGYEV